MPIGAAPELPHVNGLDVSRGLRLFAGQVEVYRESLLDFARFYGAGLASVEAYLAEPSADHLALARHEVHAMGGAGAALGATEIERLAQEFESRLRQSGPFDPAAHLGTLRTELAALIRGLRTQMNGG